MLGGCWKLYTQQNKSLSKVLSLGERSNKFETPREVLKKTSDTADLEHFRYFKTLCVT